MISRVPAGEESLAGKRFIAGSGRSGTTWVLDTLARANKLRPVFEPLHPRVSKMGKKFAHRALSSDEAHPELKRFLGDVCAGHRERLWSQYRCQGHFLIPSISEIRTYAGLAGLAHRWGKFLGEAPGFAMESARREPLVKCIWSNLMLGWLSRQCQFRVVLIVRHPGAVAESELRNFWSAKATLDQFRDDERFHELTNGRYQSLLNRKLTAVEELAVKWLVENQWAIETAPANGVTVVCHERLKSKPDTEWKKIQTAFDLPNMPDAEILARPSQQSAPQDSDFGSGTGGLPRWQRVLTSEQTGQVQRILDQMSFDLYSMNNAMPRDPNEDSALVIPSGKA